MKAWYPVQLGAAIAIAVALLGTPSLAEGKGRGNEMHKSKVTVSKSAPKGNAYGRSTEKNKNYTYKKPVKKQEYKKQHTSAGISRGPSMGSSGYRIPGVKTPLTSSQRDRIISIRSDSQRDVQAVRTNNSLSQQEKADRIRDIRNREHNRIMDVLTPQQRSEFRDWWDKRS